MAVIDITEDANGRDGNESDSREVTYTRVFTVKTDSDFDEAYVIRNSDFQVTMRDDNGVVIRTIGIPKINEGYLTPAGIGDITAFCNGVRVVPTPNKRVWRVIATYSNRLERPDLNLVDPVARQPEIEWDVQPYTYSILFDSSGNAIRNSARDPFDPPLTDEQTIMVLRVTRYREKYDEIFYNQFHNKVNSVKWSGLKKRSVRCRRIKSNRIWENARYYYRISYEFEMRQTIIPTNNLLDGDHILTEPDDDSLAWVEWILDRGYRQIVNGVPQSILDFHNPIAVTTPALLDGSGSRLAIGGTPVYLGFRTKREIDFNLLDMDLSGILDTNKGV